MRDRAVVCRMGWIGVLLLCLLGRAAFAEVTAKPSANAKSNDNAAASSNDVVLTSAVERIFSGGIPKSLDELRAMEQLQQKLVEKISPCTVNVRLGNAQGSGVIISEDGYILTAAHVATRPNQDITVTFPNGKSVAAKTLGLNRNVDAGLAKITANGKWPHAEFGDATELKPGMWCVATGHPGGFEPGRNPVVRVGRLLSISDSVLVTDCTLVGGDSGGPLFDSQGRVIGIHSRIGGALTANMHVPIKSYRDSWDRMAKAEAWGHLPGQIPYIGVRGESDAATAKITQVFNDTPASKAGLQVGDVVIKFAGQEVTNFSSLTALVADQQPGERVPLEVRRGEQTVKLEITIGKRGG